MLPFSLPWWKVSDAKFAALRCCCDVIDAFSSSTPTASSLCVFAIFYMPSSLSLVLVFVMFFHGSLGYHLQEFCIYTIHVLYLQQAFCTVLQLVMSEACIKYYAASCDILCLYIIHIISPYIIIDNKDSIFDVILFYLLGPKSMFSFLPISVYSFANITLLQFI